jgi:hypothetical protein
VPDKFLTTKEVAEHLGIHEKQVYALVKAGKVLDRVDAVLGDVDREALPLMQKAGTTLDGVNANLGNVDQITKDVADITDKIDNMANAVEGAVSTPARKAASFSAGVQGAVSSFMRRDKSAPSGGSTADSGSAGQWSASAAAAGGDAAAKAASATAAAASDAADTVAGAARGAAAPDVADEAAAAVVPETDAKV